MFARGVTDGLPVVPPTRERVEAAIAACGRPRDELIALVAPAHGRATVERIAVNAVMAGCRPEYLPVVIAGVPFTALIPGWPFADSPARLVLKKIRPA